jgi:hypothetical protein
LPAVFSTNQRDDHLNPTNQKTTCRFMRGWFSVLVSSPNNTMAQAQNRRIPRSWACFSCRMENDSPSPLRAAHAFYGTFPRTALAALLSKIRTFLCVTHVRLRA